MSFKHLFLILLLTAAILSCKKSNQNDKIPNVPVSITLYLNLPSNLALNSVGNYVKIQGGYKGIIVYRRSQSEFAAFDLACPFDPNVSGSILEVDSGGTSVYDKICGSRFLLSYGSILNGPATLPLKEYATDYDGGNIVYIYN